MLFSTREEAGQALARRLADMPEAAGSIVLALPRGGVPVGHEIAKALGAKLDLLLVRKIGVPFQPELAAAALVEGQPPALIMNDTVVQALGLRRSDLQKAADGEMAEIERRRKLYLDGRAPLDIKGKQVIVVDDGIATGTTVKAALQALRQRKPKKLILAVPVAPAETLRELEPLVDDLVCLESPYPFRAISLFYRDFHQVSDEEVIRLLAEQETK